jgi:hypothetical protein
VTDIQVEKRVNGVLEDCSFALAEAFFKYILMFRVIDDHVGDLFDGFATFYR